MFSIFHDFPGRPFCLDRTAHFEMSGAKNVRNMNYVFLLKCRLPPGVLWEGFWVLLGSLGRPPGPLGATLVTYWGLVGILWSALAANFALLGPLCKCTVLFLCVFWWFLASLRVYFVDLGVICDSEVWYGIVWYSMVWYIIV